MINLPFTISSSTSFLRLSTAEIGETTVEFGAWVKEEKRHMGVRFKFKRCVGARMNGMGGEVQQGIGVLTESQWLREITQLQQRFYPEHKDNFKEVKHFFFRGHDVSVEVLAEDYEWSEIHSGA